MKTPKPKNPDLRDNVLHPDPTTRDDSSPPGAPERILERGYGDEHGGYLIQPEPDDEPFLPGADPVPGARP